MPFPTIVFKQDTDIKTTVYVKETGQIVALIFDMGRSSQHPFQVKFKSFFTKSWAPGYDSCKACTFFEDAIQLVRSYAPIMQLDLPYSHAA